MKKKHIILLIITVAVLFSVPCVFALTGISTVGIDKELIVKENRIYSMLDSERKQGENVQDYVEYYSYFLSVLKPTSAEKEYVDRLISNGFDVEAVVKIFDFWRYTDEDMSIIEEAYGYKPYDVKISYWVDDAFIFLCSNGKTKGEFVDMSVEKVEEYMAGGIAPEEIRAADKFGRRGVLNADEILSQRLSGKSWCEIANTVYDFKLSDEEIHNYENIDDPFEFIDVFKVSARTGENAKELLDKASDGISISKMNSDFKKEKMEEAKTVLTRQKIWTKKADTNDRKRMFCEEALF